MVDDGVENDVGDIVIAYCKGIFMFWEGLTSNYKYELGYNIISIVSGLYLLL